MNLGGRFLESFGQSKRVKTRDFSTPQLEISILISVDFFRLYESKGVLFRCRFTIPGVVEKYQAEG